MQDPQHAGLEVLARARVRGQAPVGRVHGDRVDAEVAPGEILGQRHAEPHVGQRSGRRVGLRPGARHVEHRGRRVDGGRPEALVDGHLAPEALGRAAGDGLGGALDDEVELGGHPPQERVAHGAADHVHARLAGHRGEHGRACEPLTDPAGHPGNLDRDVPAGAETAPAADRDRPRAPGRAPRERGRGLRPHPRGRRVQPRGRVPRRADRHPHARGGAGGGARGPEAADGSLGPVHLAALRLHARPAPLPAGVQDAPPAVLGAVAVPGRRAARVPAGDRRALAVPAQQRGHPALDRQAHGQGALAAQARPPRRLLARPTPTAPCTPRSSSGPGAGAAARPAGSRRSTPRPGRSSGRATSRAARSPRR